MKKVLAIVLYMKSTLQIYSLTAVHKSENIPLIRYNVNDTIQPFKYQQFNDLYKSVLNILKENNMYVSKYQEFNTVWYNIQWIDIENPYNVKKYPFTGKI